MKAILPGHQMTVQYNTKYHSYSRTNAINESVTKSATYARFEKRVCVDYLYVKIQKFCQSVLS